MKVTKAALLEEIWNSKLSHSQVIDKAFTKPDVIVVDLSEVTLPNLTVRLDSDAHVARAAIAGKGKQGHLEGASFDPFILYRSYLDDDGKLAFRETVRSHERIPKTAITNKLGILLLAMAESYARRGNWRGYSYAEEFVSEGLFNLTKNVLKFHEGKSDNPHAYITRCLQTSFFRELKSQKKQSSIKDEVLIMHGRSPSLSAQMRSEQDR